MYHKGNFYLEGSLNDGAEISQLNFRYGMMTPSGQPEKLLVAALEYAERGWPVFPLHNPTEGGCSCSDPRCQSVGKHPRTKHGLKEATRDPDTICEWWRKWPHANVAIVTGSDSGLVVLDVDPRHGGDESLQNLENRIDWHPDTVEVITGGGGRHIYLKHPGGKIQNFVGLGDFYAGLDIRADGGYVVAPPSLHESGGRHLWELSSNPADLALEPMPEGLMKLCRDGSARAQKSAPLIPEVIPEGQRNETLMSLAGTFWRRRMTSEEILVALLEVNRRRGRPPLDEAEVRKIVESVQRYPQRGEPYRFTDVDNARRLVDRFNDRLRYWYAGRRWYTWDGKRWAVDDTGQVEYLARETARGLYDEVSKIDDKKEREKLIKWANRSNSDGAIRAMMNQARSEPEIVLRADELDRDPWLLNVLNGTLDLRTGELRPHQRKDLITKLSPVKYDPGSKAPRWEAFIDRITDGNANLRGFLRRATGYALTGDVSERTLFFLYGTGANGKSTFLRSLLDMIGDYGKQAEPELLVIKQPGAHTTGLADLAGCRLAVCQEVEKGRRMAEAMVKQITGGTDRAKARFMRADFFEFSPTHKVFLAANHKPIIRGTDHAIWDRVKLVPFNVRIPEGEQDKHLIDKLREELPGILAWAVRGCQEWVKDGLQTPEEVKRATSAYMEEMDTLGPFFSEMCFFDEPSATVKASTLYKAYKKWAEENGEKQIGNRNFGEALIERGVERGRDNKGNFYRLQLRDYEGS